ncbi:hypothetical protein DUNSADRAFT_9025 [Dunaliella salina]|uniref:Uncharacterized protein n=1 Tax=Dunaliella salina TaxID=3046 RepID=A0ABQ7GID0_DUNSA|nr:hypothetical protein DUNSADRAFT_9025 [Dunaliella salina]|eukprot:KAF5834324.1 hypothetical protein DUNSADRAFT_9025 [Dunaliella salina]
MANSPFLHETPVKCAGPDETCHLSATTAAPPNPKSPGKPAGVPPQSLPVRLNPTRLLEAVSVPERHFVTYVPRSNIPRLLRQGTADMLLGRYLSHLVGLCQHATPAGQRTEAKALEAVRADADLRATARLTAAAHETALYKQVTSKHAYTALSTNTECSLATLRLHAPADRLEQLLSKYGTSAAAAFAPPPAKAPPAAAAPSRPSRQAVSEDTHDLFDSSSSSEQAEGSSEEDASSSEESGSEGGAGSQSPVETGPGHEHVSNGKRADRQEEQQKEAPVGHEVGSQSPPEELGPGDERPSIRKQTDEQGAQQKEDSGNLKTGSPLREESCLDGESSSIRKEASKRGAQEQGQAAPAGHEASSPARDQKVLEPPACSAGGDTQPDGQQQQQQQLQRQQRQQQAKNGGGGLSPGEDHQQQGGSAGFLGPKREAEQHSFPSGQEQLGGRGQHCGDFEGERCEGQGGLEGHEGHVGHEEEHGHGGALKPGCQGGQHVCHKGHKGHEDQRGHQEDSQSKAAACASGAPESLQHEEHATEMGPQEELRGEDLQGTCQGFSHGRVDEEGGHDGSCAEEQEEEDREQKESVCNSMTAGRRSSHGRGGEKGGRHRSKSSRAQDDRGKRDDEGNYGSDGNRDGEKAGASSSDKRSRQRHRSSTGRKREEVEEEGRGKEGGGVYAQVVAFVRGLLNPLYKARLIPKDRFKAIVQRSSQKIMDRHQGAPDASFLLHEHEAIRRFVLKMVEASQ